MKLSIKKFKPTYKEDGKLDKMEAMFSCARDFKVKFPKTINELYTLVCANCVYAPVKWSNNHRNKANAQLDIDLLVFDVDDGLTIDEVLDTVGAEYEILVLETASHKEAHHKFRVFIPLANTITFKTPSEYREFYKFIDKEFNLNCDDKTMEAGRGYIGLKGKIGYVSESTKRLNISGRLLDSVMVKVRHKILAKRWRQEKATLIQEKFRRDNNIKVPSPISIQSDRHFKQKAENCVTGEHYSAVYTLLGYCKFRGQTASEAADSVCLLNLDGEYSDKDDLINKYMGLK